MLFRIFGRAFNLFEPKLDDLGVPYDTGFNRRFYGKRRQQAITSLKDNLTKQNRHPAGFQADVITTLEKSLDEANIFQNRSLLPELLIYLSELDTPACEPTDPKSEQRFLALVNLLKSYYANPTIAQEIYNQAKAISSENYEQKLAETQTQPNQPLCPEEKIVALRLAKITNFQVGNLYILHHYLSTNKTLSFPIFNNFFKSNSDDESANKRRVLFNLRSLGFISQSQSFSASNLVALLANLQHAQLPGVIITKKIFTTLLEFMIHTPDHSRKLIDSGIFRIVAIHADNLTPDEEDAAKLIKTYFYQDKTSFLDCYQILREQPKLLEQLFGDHQQDPNLLSQFVASQGNYGAVAFLHNQRSWLRNQSLVATIAGCLAADPEDHKADNLLRSFMIFGQQDPIVDRLCDAIQSMMANYSNLNNAQQTVLHTALSNSALNRVMFIHSNNLFEWFASNRNEITTANRIAQTICQDKTLYKLFKHSDEFETLASENIYVQARQSIDSLLKDRRNGFLKSTRRKNAIRAVVENHDSPLDKAKAALMKHDHRFMKHLDAKILTHQPFEWFWTSRLVPSRFRASKSDINNRTELMQQRIESFKAENFAAANAHHQPLPNVNTLSDRHRTTYSDLVDSLDEPGSQQIPSDIADNFTGGTSTEVTVGDANSTLSSVAPSPRRNSEADTDALLMAKRGLHQKDNLDTSNQPSLPAESLIEGCRP